PERRQLRIAGELGVLGHDRRRLARADDEEVEQDGGSRRQRRQELAIGSREVERAERLMDEESPAVRADDPRHRHAAAMRAELIAALTTAHAVGRSAAIELRSTLAEAEQRTVAEGKAKRAAGGVD